MADEPDQPLAAEDECTDAERTAHLEERAQLIDAARESARTFDKAVLTFGAAVFGFSVAFLKDVAPHPASGTLRWLAAAWILFSFGLATILASFLFSQQACQSEIDESFKALASRGYSRKKNHWSTLANRGNAVCVTLLFLGLLCWSIFAIANLSHVEATPVSHATAAKRN